MDISFFYLVWGTNYSHTVVNEPCPFIHYNTHVFNHAIWMHSSCTISMIHIVWVSCLFNAIHFIALSSFIANIDAPQQWFAQSKGQFKRHKMLLNTYIVFIVHIKYLYYLYKGFIYIYGKFQCKILKNFLHF